MNRNKLEPFGGTCQLVHIASGESCVRESDGIYTLGAPEQQMGSCGYRFKTRSGATGHS